MAQVVDETVTIDVDKIIIEEEVPEIPWLGIALLGGAAVILALAIGIYTR